MKGVADCIAFLVEQTLSTFEVSSNLVRCHDMETNVNKDVCKDSSIVLVAFIM